MPIDDTASVGDPRLPLEGIQRHESYWVLNNRHCKALVGVTTPMAAPRCKELLNRFQTKIMKIRSKKEGLETINHKILDADHLRRNLLRASGRPPGFP